MTVETKEKRETFTPGDWHVQDLSLPHSRRLPYLIINDDVHSVARACQEQDARLIAAAPEMYEMCKLLLPVMQRDAKDRHIRAGESRRGEHADKLREILAKVEGGTP